MHLQDAHLARLLHHRDPHLGGEFLVDALKLDGIGAIGALQWAAMRELGEQADRSARAECCCGAAAHALGGLVVHDDGFAMSIGLKLLGHPFMYPLSARPWSRSSTSVRITSAGAEYSSARDSTISSTVLLPLQSLSTATAVWSGIRIRSGARSSHRPRPAS